MSFCRGFGILTAVVTVGVVLGWVGNRPPDANTNTFPFPHASQPNAPSDLASLPQFSPPGRSNPATRDSEALRDESLQPEPTGEWEQRLENILAAETDNAEKAKQLLGLFPHLPEAGQIEAAQHLSYLVPDGDYPALDRYLTNSAMPDPVLNLLLAGTLNRPNALKMPLLLEVARDGQHPKATDARDLLRLFMGQDFGEDWARWQAGVDEWLRENPE